MSTKPKFVKAKTLEIPLINLNPVSLTEQAFENIREWRLSHGEEITRDDLKWYYEALEEDKRLESVVVEVKKDDEDDLGPMPTYGSSEFWAWCRKRKEIRLQKEAEIIAAGGTIPVKGKKK